MKKIFILFILCLSLFACNFFVSDHVFAQSGKSTNYGLDEVASTKTKVSANPSELIGKAIGSVLGFVSVIFFLLTIYGGILWMTSRGNEQQTDKALSTITSAAIGLAIVLGSYVLVSFLFKTVGAGTGGESGGAQCQNPLTGLGAPCDEDNPCDLGTGLVFCSPISHTCVSNADALCGQRCGSQFECTNQSDCTGGTAVTGYCTGADVCCVPK